LQSKTEATRNTASIASAISAGVRQANSQKMNWCGNRAGLRHDCSRAGGLNRFIFHNDPEYDVGVDGDLHRSPDQPAAVASLISSIVIARPAERFSNPKIEATGLPDFALACIRPAGSKSTSN
jgi:hypothetical protein